MKKDCSQSERIIRDFIIEIERTKIIWNELGILNPHFEQLSEDHWCDKEASIWLHGETRPHELNQLEKWLFISAPESQTAYSPAINHYLEWSEHILEEGVYADFEESDLLMPQKDETLNEYVIRLSYEVERNGWGTKKQERAIKSFLNYLRNYNEKEEIAFIEHIFPEKCELRAGRIIRIIRPQVYPIPREIAGKIIRELAYQCAFGRANARHHAAEALALLWLCLSSSRIRWPRSLESVHTIKSNALITNAETPSILVPSIFGPHPLGISQRCSEFFQAIAQIPSEKPRDTVLQTSLPDLRKAFNTAVAKVNPAPELGEITFLTFLSHPHYFGNDIR